MIVIRYALLLLHIRGMIPSTSLTKWCQHFWADVCWSVICLLWNTENVTLNTIGLLYICVREMGSNGHSSFTQELASSKVGYNYYLINWFQFMIFHKWYSVTLESLIPALVCWLKAWTTGRNNKTCTSR